MGWNGQEGSVCIGRGGDPSAVATPLWDASGGSEASELLIYSQTSISARIRWMNVVALIEITLIELNNLWRKIIWCIREVTLRAIITKKQKTKNYI